MLSINRAKKILGKKYSHLSDEQLEVLVGRTYYLAELALGLREEEVFQSPAGIIDFDKEKLNDKTRG